MYRRGPISRDLASLVARSILASLDKAEAYPTPGDHPLGALRHDLGTIATAPENTREVRGKLHASMIEGVSLFLAHAVDHIRALANDMRRARVPPWPPPPQSRAVRDSPAGVCPLLPPASRTKPRLCRTAALWLDESQPARAAASTFGAEHAVGVAD